MVVEGERRTGEDETSDGEGEPRNIAQRRGNRNDCWVEAWWKGERRAVRLDSERCDMDWEATPSSTCCISIGSNRPVTAVKGLSGAGLAATD